MYKVGSGVETLNKQNCGGLFYAAKRAIFSSVMDRSLRNPVDEVSVILRT